MFKRTAPLLILILFAGCSPDDPLINSFDDSWRYLVSGSGGVSSIRMPEGVVDNRSIWVPVTDELYPVTAITAFRDDIYLLRNTEEIVILDRETLLAIDTISLPGKGQPAAIAFANASTAYVALPLTKELGVIDLSVNLLVRSIPLEGAPTDVSILGNQVCVTLQINDAVQIIDTRTNAVTRSIPIATPAPTFVASDPINQVFAVVSLGAGKLNDDNRARTTPMLSFINIENWTPSIPIALTLREDQGPEQIPTGIIVNTQQFAFVPVQNSFLLISTRSQNRASPLQQESYSSVSYDGARSEIITIGADGRSIDVYDDLGENRRHRVLLTDSVTSVIGIAP